VSPTGWVFSMSSDAARGRDLSVTVRGRTTTGAPALWRSVTTRRTGSTPDRASSLHPAAVRMRVRLEVREPVRKTIAARSSVSWAHVASVRVYD
jgi:hypothetical protein